MRHRQDNLLANRTLLPGTDESPNDFGKNH